MKKTKEIFKRVEKKYLVTAEQKELILERIKDYVRMDKYGPSTICNIYFDNDFHDLIRTSIDKPLYKEKVRMRSYNVPDDHSPVFLEIKKKYDGVVYKRRISTDLHDMEEYLYHGASIDCNEQIKKEIDYCFQFYGLKPKLFLSYDRIAFYDKIDDEFRISFDTNITSRDYDLDLKKGVYGEKLLKEGIYIMETKCINTYPMWFVKVLEELHIYPSSFSKYGNVYTETIKREYSQLFSHDEYGNENTEMPEEVELIKMKYRKIVKV